MCTRENSNTKINNFFIRILTDNWYQLNVVQVSRKANKISPLPGNCICLAWIFQFIHSLMKFDLLVNVVCKNCCHWKKNLNRNAITYLSPSLNWSWRRRTSFYSRFKIKIPFFLRDIFCFIKQGMTGLYIYVNANDWWMWPVLRNNLKPQKPNKTHSLQM